MRWGNIGMNILDSMDTLWVCGWCNAGCYMAASVQLMGLRDEFNRATDWVGTSLDFGVLD